MTDELDVSAIQAQLDDAIRGAINSLSMPACDAECQANKTLAGLQNQVAAAHIKADTAQQGLAAAQEKYFVRMKGQPAFVADRNRALKSSSSKEANAQIDGLEKQLNSLQAPINAAASLEDISKDTTDVGIIYKERATARTNKLEKEETSALISERKAVAAEELRGDIMHSVNGWMRYAYFLAVAFFLVRMAFMGAWTVRGNMLRIAVVMLLPFGTTKLSRLMQQYSPFGSKTTNRLHYLYTKGL
jgi:hypothetical protein